MKIGTLLQVLNEDDSTGKRIYKVATAPLVIGSGLLGAGVGAVGGAIGGAVMGAGMGGITGGALGVSGSIAGLNYLYGDVDSRPYSKLEKKNKKAQGIVNTMKNRVKQVKHMI